MAIIYLPSPFQMVRQHDKAPFTDMVFTTTAARVAFLTSPRRYGGMFVSDLEEDKVYRLNAAKDTWLLLGEVATPSVVYTSFKKKVGVDAGAPTAGLTTYTNTDLIGATDFNEITVNNQIETKDEDWTFNSLTGEIDRAPNEWAAADVLICKFNKPI